MPERNEPTAQAYFFFITRYRFGGRDQLADRISESDLQILDEWAAVHEAETTTDNERLRRDQLAFFADRRGQDAVDLARKYERVLKDSSARRLERDQQRINQLSEQGRQAIENYIEQSIGPELSQGQFDEIERAKEDPEAYLRHLDLIRHVLETGEFPEEIQKALDARFPKVRTENQGGFFTSLDKKPR